MENDKYQIREICGDYVLDIAKPGAMLSMWFNSRTNAELVKNIMEWEDAHPNEAAPCHTIDANKAAELRARLEAYEATGLASEDDFVRRGDVLNAIRKACVLGHIPFDSKTPEGQRTLEALRAVSATPSAPAIDATQLIHASKTMMERLVEELKGERGKEVEI